MMWGWNYYDGWAWIGMTAVLLLLVVLAIGMIGAFRGPRQESDSAMAVLRRRLAAGEISQEDFEKTKKFLQGVMDK
jgi:uncharacterized membrane protein